MTEAEQIMKRCQVGTRNYEEANNLHAACYGMIGKLLAQEKALQALHSENERLGLYKDAYAQPEQNIAELVEGMEVSIDISTGDHDSTHRLFGVVDLVQENQKSKHGLILLVQEPKSNFKETLAQPEQEPSGHFLDFAYSDSIAYVHVYDQFRKGQQFYKAPPQRTWVGLTDEELHQICNSLDYYGDRGLVELIEAKLKLKNGYSEEKNT